MSQNMKILQNNFYLPTANTRNNSSWQESVKLNSNQKIAVIDLSKKLSDEDQVKSIISNSVKKLWPIYKNKYPKAFRDNPNLKKRNPEIVYINNKKDLGKVYSHPSVSTPLAFVRSSEPNKIYFYMPSAIHTLKTYGSIGLHKTVSHEMIHCVTNATSMRLAKDINYSHSYNDAYFDVNKTINLLPFNREGQNLKPSIPDILKEGVADIVSEETTGFKSIGTFYEPYREITRKVISLVGRKTYDEAMFENNPISYEKVVKAAVVLKKQYDEKYNEPQTNPIGYWINAYKQKMGW